MIEEHYDKKVEDHKESKDKDILKESVKKCKANLWMPATVLLAILLVLSFVFPMGNLSNVSENVVGERIIEFAQSQGVEAEILSVEPHGSLYEISLTINGEPTMVYATKDGENIVSGVFPLTTQAISDTDDTNTASNTNPNIPKTNKPVVELFVMTHCPYGTQAEKGMIPVLKLLGDKIDGKIRFVHYFMHTPEETETPIQVCIREEQADKFLDYLECFLEDGDSDSCLVEAQIDQTKVQQCIDSGKADEYYEEDSILSQGYGVQGSPTLIINGVQSSAGRSPSSYLAGVCEAFTDAATSCDNELSSDTPSPGFGYGGSGSDTTAQC